MMSQAEHDKEDIEAKSLLRNEHPQTYGATAVVSMVENNDGVDRLSALPQEMINTITPFFNKPQHIVNLAGASKKMYALLQEAPITTIQGEMKGKDFLKRIFELNKAQPSTAKKILASHNESRMINERLGRSTFLGSLAIFLPFTEIYFDRHYPISTAAKIGITASAVAVMYLCLYGMELCSQRICNKKSLLDSVLPFLYDLIIGTLVLMLSGYFSTFIVDLKDKETVAGAIVFCMLFTMACSMGTSLLLKNATLLYSAQVDHAKEMQEKIENLLGEETDINLLEEDVNIGTTPGLIN